MPGRSSIWGTGKNITGRALSLGTDDIENYLFDSQKMGNNLKWSKLVISRESAYSLCY